MNALRITTRAERRGRLPSSCSRPRRRRLGPLRPPRAPFQTIRSPSRRSTGTSRSLCRYRVSRDLVSLRMRLRWSRADSPGSCRSSPTDDSLAPSSSKAAFKAAPRYLLMKERRRPLSQIPKRCRPTARYTCSSPPAPISPNNKLAVYAPRSFNHARTFFFGRVGRQELIIRRDRRAVVVGLLRRRL